MLIRVDNIVQETSTVAHELFIELVNRRITLGILFYSIQTN